MSKFLILIFGILLLAVSCRHVKEEVIVPDPILNNVPAIAEKYLGMPYEWGGQSFWYEEDGTVDCSGLVVNVYKEACNGSGYRLLFEDSTSHDMHSKYTVEVSAPKAGDLIFMGEGGVVSHVAIFRRFVGDDVEFLDAYSVDGHVMIRTYGKGNLKIISYGRMLLSK
jgi:hypothetical protein